MIAERRAAYAAAAEANEDIAHPSEFQPSSDESGTLAQRRLMLVEHFTYMYLNNKLKWLKRRPMESGVAMSEQSASSAIQ